MSINGKNDLFWAFWPRILVGLVCFLLTQFLLPKTVWAGAITGISYGESGSVVGTYVQASQSDFVVFTPATALAAAVTVEVTFPVGTVLTSAS